MDCAYETGVNVVSIAAAHELERGIETVGLTTEAAAHLRHLRRPGRAADRAGAHALVLRPRGPGAHARLLTELPGIFNWAVHGYQLLRQRGYFAQPASAREAIEDLEVLASPIKAFINDRCNVGPGLAVSVELLYQTLVRIGAKQSAARSTAPSRPSAAASRPPSQACEPHRPRDDDNRYRSYEGIGLKGTSEP